jgi:hypothetical protein
MLHSFLRPGPAITDFTKTVQVRCRRPHGFTGHPGRFFRGWVWSANAPTTKTPRMCRNTRPEATGARGQYAPKATGGTFAAVAMYDFVLKGFHHRPRPWFKFFSRPGQLQKAEALGESRSPLAHSLCGSNRVGLSFAVPPHVKLPRHSWHLVLRQIEPAGAGQRQSSETT